MTASTCQVRRRAYYAWLLRGVIGITLLALAISTRESLVVIPALLLALVAFRGCPMCWVFELVERGSQDCAPSGRKEAS